MTESAELQGQVESLERRVTSLEDRGQPALEPGARERIRGLQTWLAAQGFDPGPLDGIYGPRTAAALRARAFEEVNRVAMDQAVKLTELQRLVEQVMERANRLDKLNEEWHQEIRRLRLRMVLLEELAGAAAAIRQKIDGQLQVLNADHWIGPELRRLDAAFKALERRAS